jgi:uncharacterized membrane protein
MWPLVRFNVIGDAWRLYRRHWDVWTLAMLIVLIGSSVVMSVVLAILGVNWPGGRGGFRLPVPPAAAAIQYVASAVIGGCFLGGMIRMASNQVRGRVPRIEDLISVTDVWLDLLLSALTYGVATFLGEMLCVIPGLIVSGLLMFAIPLVVEARLPAAGAILQSWNALKSQWLTATVFHLVLFLLSGSGVLLCCIGILITGPLYSLSIAILYHEFFPAPPAAAWNKPDEPFPEI